MKVRDEKVLRSVGETWTNMGPSKPHADRRDGRLVRVTAPRMSLHRLMDLGLVVVRTATYSRWWPKDYKRGDDQELESTESGAWVEARLTPQGVDVKTSIGE